MAQEKQTVSGYSHTELRAQAAKLLAMMDAEFEVQEPSDPHADNKKLYEQDALVYGEPWKLWEFCFREVDGWFTLEEEPDWLVQNQYRRKQTKKLVDWSCPLLKGANTNYGELYTLHAQKNFALLSGASNAFIGLEQLRLLPPSNDKSNWQAYNGEDLNRLHEAGFVVEVKYFTVTTDEYAVAEYRPACTNTSLFAAYRVIAIRYGFTANPEEVV